MDTFEKQHLNFDKGKKAPASPPAAPAALSAAPSPPPPPAAQVSPFTVPALLPNTGAGILAIELGCTGPNYGVVSACAAGSHAIGTALRQMQYGEVGCAEMRCCEGERLCRDAAEREALSRHFRDTAEAISGSDAAWRGPSFG